MPKLRKRLIRLNLSPRTNPIEIYNVFRGEKDAQLGLEEFFQGRPRHLDAILFFESSGRDPNKNRVRLGFGTGDILELVELE